MLKVYTCVVSQHDLRLVFLALVICLVSAYSALGLLSRSRGRTTSWHHAWLASAAAVTGSGVWATHFVAMLAFQPGFAIGYDFGQTILSIAIAMMLTWLGLAAASRAPGPLVGGAIIGLGIGGMHFAGMEAVSGAADLQWDVALVLTALGIGVGFAAAALCIASAPPTRRRTAAAALLLTFAICGLHFTGMAAVSFIPDPSRAAATDLAAPEWLPAAIAVAMAFVIALGAVSIAADRRLRLREREAERMRAYITQLERTQRELETTTTDLHEALDKAAAASQAKSQFLAIMSHELRTPLNAVIGFSEILASAMYGPLGDGRYQEYAESIRQSGQHLLDVINDILDFSKIEAGHLDLVEEDIDLNTVVSESVVMVDIQAARQRVVVETQFAPALPRLTADPRRIRQVVLNLLSNAIKFTPAGGVIRVTTVLRDGGVAVTVSDSGIGIAADDIPRSLEPFRQIDNRFARKFGGAGLGLPLSKRLVERHGGRLDLHSIVGIGTTVSARFPASRVVAAAPAVRIEPEPAIP